MNLEDKIKKMADFLDDYYDSTGLNRNIYYMKLVEKCKKKILEEQIDRIFDAKLGFHPNETNYR